MSTLKSWDQYSGDELKILCQKSTAIKYYLDLIRRSGPKTTDTSFTFTDLRIVRHQAWVEAAAATILKNQPAENICLQWSLATDAIVQRAWQLTGLDTEPISLWALGKWGAKELNLSSDIDIMLISENSPDADLLKKVRTFIQQLSENSTHGFLYRVDTDLKPGGRLAPIISSYKQTEDYYWSVGATWERLALVRLRAICAPDVLKEKVNALVEKFVYRKFIDFSLLEDLKLLRRQIHAHAISDPEYIHLKLCPGGIRDIELFTHALQVIHGGKDPELRNRSTAQALDAIATKNRFPPQDLRFLGQCYWEFRTLENLVQANEDQQTHLFLKASDPTEAAHFLENAKRVESIVEQVLGDIAGQSTMPQHDPEKHIFLEKLGFADPDLVKKIDELLSLTAFSKTYEYEEMRLKVIRQFLEGLSTIALDKRLGLSLLVDFFRATRAKAGFFTLLLREDRLIRELCLLFGASPYLGSILTSRPELLDSYLFRTISSAPTELESYLEHLSEKKLLNEIIAANQFLQNHQLDPLLRSTSTCADEIATSLLMKITEEQGQNSELYILALGKWGSQELGLKSDLDFIFVTTDTASEAAQKLARRFLSRLTEAHRGGSIYQTDMRLRPTGKSGPLIVSVESLVDYLKTRAEAWERQSYLRARFIGATPENWTQKIRSACYSRKLTPDDLSGLSKIRSQLISQKANDADLKYAAGGLMDVEMAVQIEILFTQHPCPANDTAGMLDHLFACNAQWQPAAHKIKNNYLFLRQIEQLHQLVSQHSGAFISSDSENFLRLSKTARLSPTELLETLEHKLMQNNELLKRLDRRQAP